MSDEQSKQALTPTTVDAGENTEAAAPEILNSPEIEAMTAKPSASAHLAEMRRNPEAIRELFLTGEYPYKTKLSTKEYERKKKALQVEALPERRSTTRRQQPAAAAARHLPASQVMAYNQNVRPASDYAENDNTKRRRLSDMVDPLAVRTHHHTPVACVFLGALAALCLIQLLHCSLIASWLRCNRGPFGL